MFVTTDGAVPIATSWAARTTATVMEPARTDVADAMMAFLALPVRLRAPVCAAKTVFAPLLASARASRDSVAKTATSPPFAPVRILLRDLVEARSVVFASWPRASVSVRPATLDLTACRRRPVVSWVAAVMESARTASAGVILGGLEMIAKSNLAV